MTELWSDFRTNENKNYFDYFLGCHKSGNFYYCSQCSYNREPLICQLKKLRSSRLINSPYIHRQPSTIHCLPTTVCHPPSSIHRRPSSACCQQITTENLQFHKNLFNSLAIWWDTITTHFQGDTINVAFYGSTLVCYCKDWQLLSI